MAGTTQMGKAEAGVDHAMAEAATARAEVTPMRAFLMTIPPKEPTRAPTGRSGGLVAMSVCEI
jgi:hypothetical protein